MIVKFSEPMEAKLAVIFDLFEDHGILNEIAESHSLQVCQSVFGGVVFRSIGVNGLDEWVRMAPELMRRHGWIYV